jgi:hypothetical protein
LSIFSIFIFNAIPGLLLTWRIAVSVWLRLS